VISVFPWLSTVHNF